MGHAGFKICPTLVDKQSARMVLEHRGEYPSLWAAIALPLHPLDGLCATHCAGMIKNTEVDSVRQESLPRLSARGPQNVSYLFSTAKYWRKQASDHQCEET